MREHRTNGSASDRGKRMIIMRCVRFLLLLLVLFALGLATMSTANAGPERSQKAIDTVVKILRGGG